jgi:hypothetical protein
MSCAISLIVEILEKRVSNVNGKLETICLLETNLPASAWWFILASGEILRTGGNVDHYYFQDTELRNGKPGFSKRRCDLWNKKLSEFQTVEQLSEDTRELSRRAAVSLGKAQRAKK